MHDIQIIFDQVQKLLPELTLQLASGGLPDCKGPGTSDVDIVTLHEHYDQLLHLMPAGTKQIVDDLKPRTKYLIPWFAREVVIYATSDLTLAAQSTTHRANEIALLRFPLLTAQAIGFKQQGNNTEQARCLALGLEGNPYEQMMRDDLLDIAQAKEKQLAEYMDNLK